MHRYTPAPADRTDHRLHDALLTGTLAAMRWMSGQASQVHGFAPSAFHHPGESSLPPVPQAGSAGSTGRGGDAGRVLPPAPPTGPPDEAGPPSPHEGWRAEIARALEDHEIPATPVNVDFVEDAFRLAVDPDAAVARDAAQREFFNAVGDEGWSEAPDLGSGEGLHSFTVQELASIAETTHDNYVMDVVDQERAFFGDDQAGADAFLESRQVRHDPTGGRYEFFDGSAAEYQAMLAARYPGEAIPEAQLYDERPLRQANVERELQSRYPDPEQRAAAIEEINRYRTKGPLPGTEAGPAPAAQLPAPPADP
jgi:hypothetical protein